MTKASLRRQREQEESAAAEVKDQPQTPSQPLNTPVQRPDVPRMDSPPPYDAPHLPPHFRNTQSPGQDQADPGPGCWNSGSGKADGCMNYSSGNRGPDFVVDGCCNYDSRKFSPIAFRYEFVFQQGLLTRCSGWVYELPE